MKCGRGPEQENDICPAASDPSFDGMNDGINAGRNCWLVVGTAWIISPSYLLILNRYFNRGVKIKNRLRKPYAIAMFTKNIFKFFQNAFSGIFILALLENCS